MSSPGWYPDPGGASGLERYWDGSGWTEQTRAETPAPPPTWQDTRPRTVTPWAAETPTGRPRRTGLVVGLVALAAVVVGGGVVGVLALTGDDPAAKTPVSGTTGSAGSPTAGPSEQVLAACPQYEQDGEAPAGRSATAGGLTVRLPQGYAVEDDYQYAFPYTQDTVVAGRPHPGTEWTALMILGRLPTTGGYTSTEQAAKSLIGCLSRDEKWFELDRIEPRDSEAVDIDGAEGWRATADVHLRGAPWQKDLLYAVVVDTGSPDEYAVFFAGVPGDRRYAGHQRQVEAAISGLAVG